MPLRGSMGMGGIGGRKEKGGSDVIILKYFFKKKNNQHTYHVYGFKIQLNNFRSCICL